MSHLQFAQRWSEKSPAACSGCVVGSRTLIYARPSPRPTVMSAIDLGLCGDRRGRAPGAHDVDTAIAKALAPGAGRGTGQRRREPRQMAGDPGQALSYRRAAVPLTTGPATGWRLSRAAETAMLHHTGRGRSQPAGRRPKAACARLCRRTSASFAEVSQSRRSQNRWGSTPSLPMPFEPDAGGGQKEAPPPAYRGAILLRRHVDGVVGRSLTYSGAQVDHDAVEVEQFRRPATASSGDTTSTTDPASRRGHIRDRRQAH